MEMTVQDYGEMLTGNPKLIELYNLMKDADSDDLKIITDLACRLSRK